MNQKLKVLYKEWNRKLAKSGFVDIEKDGQLKVHECLKWKAPSNYRAEVTIQARIEFYDIARDFLVDWADLFMSDTERIIWEYYCDGLGCRAIAIELKKNHGIRTNKDYVHWAIRDLKVVMFEVMNVRR